MSNLENFSQESSELKEINWVKQQIKAELQSLQSTATQEAFYTKNPDTGKVDYNLATVKSYLESIKDRDWKGLRAKNTSAWIMAVQIALEAQGYDGGKIDGVFGSQMKQQVLQFQTDKGIGKDGIPGSETIKAILDNRGGGTSTPAQPQTAEQNPAAPTTQNPAAPATTPTAPAQNPEKLKPEPQLPPLNKLTTKDVGTWQGDKFVIKAGLEQQDSKGTYINVAGQKYYKDATDGLGYNIGKNSDGKPRIYIGKLKNKKLNGQGRVRRSNGACYQGEVKDNNIHGKGRYRWPNGDTEVGTFDQNQNFWNGVKTEKGKKITYKNGKPVNQ